MIRVGVLGAKGKMGSTVCQAVMQDPDLLLVAAVDTHIDSSNTVGSSSELEIEISPDIESVKEQGSQVVVDFTRADSARDNIKWLAQNSIHAVVGTTGFSSQDIVDFENLFSNTSANCLIAPNFAIGAILMIRFAELAARFMDMEIIELHHDRKIDAPSGTALLMAQRAVQARNATQNMVSKSPENLRARGDNSSGINIHSVRLKGLIAHHEAIFSSQGQSLTIRHDSFDRTSFMPGVVLAIKKVFDFPGLSVGLDSYLDL